jgi:hypothetical protein
MGSYMENSTHQSNAGIDLDIAGPDLLLSGRFSDWDAGVSMGPDLDQLQIRLAIDATSATTLDALRASADEPALFGFRGRDATPVSSGVYQVDGELSSPVGTRPLQVLVETPIQHSAVFLLSFQARKSDFGPAWTQLLSNVVPFAPREGTPAMPAHAWLTLPTLAAA